MFNAPEIIMNIKDIAEIYKINDSQEAELENAVEILENNIFLEKMGEQMIARWEKIQIKLALTSKKMISDVTELLEEILPLNMTYNVQVMWNQHITLKTFTHKELSKHTHKQIREEVLSLVNENE